MGYRLKYSYLQWNTPLDSIKSLKGTTVKIGVLPNGWVAWEEDLYGYRFANLMPWNYYSLSSGQAGIAIAGPIKSGEKTYVDYEVRRLQQRQFPCVRADRHQADDRPGNGLPVRCAVAV